jgi:hypothetical protein
LLISPNARADPNKPANDQRDRDQTRPNQNPSNAQSHSSRHEPFADPVSHGTHLIYFFHDFYSFERLAGRKPGECAIA